MVILPYFCIVLISFIHSFIYLPGVITKGGTVPNIIPELTELLYYLRAPTVRELDKLINKVVACFEAAAKATGCTVSEQWYICTLILKDKFIIEDLKIRHLLKLLKYSIGSD